MTPTRWHSLLRRALLAILGVALAWAAGTITVEYYDGYEYIMTGESLVGPSLYFQPKHLLLSSWLGFCSLVFQALGLPRGLAPIHLAMLVLNLLAQVPVIVLLRRSVPTISLSSAALIAIANRVFLHYAPFALGDLMLSGIVALWALSSKRTVVEETRGVLERLLLVTICLVTRPQVVLVPAACLLVEVLEKPARILRVGGILAGSALLYLGLATVFSCAGLGFGLDPGRGLDFFLSFLLSFSGEVFTFPTNPWWATLHHFVLGFSPIIVLLVIAGIRGFQRQSRPELAFFAAAACYLFFLLFGLTASDTRYLAPIWPAAAVLAARGLARIQGRSPALALLLLVGQAAYGGVELLHFRDPFYASHLHEKISRRVEAWSGNRETYFVTPLAALFPRDHVFSINDNAYYLYSWNRAAHAFYTGSSPRALPFRASFQEHGYPRPDGIEHWLRPNEVAVVPGRGAYRTIDLPPRMEPLFLYRRRVPSTANGSTVESTAIVPAELME